MWRRRWPPRGGSRIEDEPAGRARPDGVVRAPRVDLHHPLHHEIARHEFGPASPVAVASLRFAGRVTGGSRALRRGRSTATHRVLDRDRVRPGHGTRVCSGSHRLGALDDPAESATGVVQARRHTVVGEPYTLRLAVGHAALLHRWTIARPAPGSPAVLMLTLIDGRARRRHDGRPAADVHGALRHRSRPTPARWQRGRRGSPRPRRTPSACATRSPKPRRASPRSNATRGRSSPERGAQ